MKPTYERLLQLWEESKITTERGAFGGKSIEGSAKRVAEKMGVSTSTAQKWLKEFGLLPERPQYKKLIDQIIKMYLDDDLPIYKIAEILQIQDQTVSNWLKKSGVQIKKSQERRTEEQKLIINNKISESKKGSKLSDSTKQKMSQSRIKISKEQNKRIYKNCSVCGKEFWFYSRNNQKTCSYECSYKDSEISINRSNSQKNREKLVYLSDESRNILSSKENLENYIIDKNITTSSLAKELGCSSFTIYSRLKEYGLWNKIKQSRSTGEIEIEEFFNKNNIFVEKTRKILYPYEIDLYSDKFKIGVEFNGDYWHSSIHKSSDYHQKKSMMAAGKDIFIYNIFEYEWNNKEKRELITKQLSSNFNIDQLLINARDCNIKIIGNNEKKEFLNKNHIQGNDNSSIRIGLTHNGILVSVMTFGKPRFNNKFQWELMRFCSLSGSRIRGGASKLFSYFVKNYYPETIICYSDMAKSTGKVYEFLGFTLSHISSPNYIWTNFSDTFTRYQTQMKNEKQIMTERGFYQIFDCGNKVWIWKNT